MDVCHSNFVSFPIFQEHPPRYPPRLANFGNKKNAESLIGIAFQRFNFVVPTGIEPVSKV